MLLGLLAILLLIFATSFFVAVEFALVSVRKTRIEQLAAEGSSAARQVKYAVEHLNIYLAAAQIGITLATIALGALGEPVMAQILLPPLEAILPRDIVEQFVSLHGIAIVTAIAIVTILELILGETVPKIAAIQRATPASLFLIRPMNFFRFIFTPLVWVVNVLSNAILRLLGLPQDGSHATVYTVEELQMIVESSRQAGVLDRDEEVILRRVFDFGDLTARQVMRPRTDIQGIPVTATLAEVVQVVTNNKHSRFPVYDGGLDNIVGVLHVYDVVEAQAGAVAGPMTTDSSAITTASPNSVARQGHDGTGESVSSGQGAGVESSPERRFLQSPDSGGEFQLKSITRPIKVVPETIGVADLLTQMRQGGFQMSVCIDEYGGTAGIVTLEDIVEEIVGEVRGEFEQADTTQDISVTPQGTLIDGLTPIEDVNEQLNFSIQSKNTTLGGYVFERLGRKPELGDEVTVGDHVLHVEELDGLRIAKLRLLPHPRDSVRNVERLQT